MIFIIFAFLIIALIDMPQLIKKKKKRELYVFITIFIFTFTLSALRIKNINIPSPLKSFEILMKDVLHISYKK